MRCRGKDIERSCRRGSTSTPSRRGRIISHRLRAGRAVDRQGRGVLQGNVSKHDDVGDVHSQTIADLLFPAEYLASRGQGLT